MNQYRDHAKSHREELGVPDSKDARRRRRSTRPLRIVALVAFCLGCLPGGASPGAPAPVPELVATGLYTTPGGRVFQIRKERVGEKDVVTYHGDGQVLSREELWAFEASNPPPRISPELMAKAAATPIGTELELILHHVHLPGPGIAREQRAAFQNRLAPLSEESRSIRSSIRPRETLSEEEERAWVEGGFYRLGSEDRARIRELAVRFEEESAAMNAEIAAARDLAQADDQQEMRDLVEGLGGRVVGAVSITNSLVARIPAERVAELVEHEFLARVEESTEAGPMLDHQAESTGVTGGFWPNGYDGAGAWDIAVLDSGVQQNHPALAPNSWVSNAGTTDSNGHGTGVAGILFSSDEEFRGMVFDVDEVFVAAAGSSNAIGRLGADYLVGAPNDPEALNHSWGSTAVATDDYPPQSQFWDALVDDHAVTVGQAAGNFGCDTSPTCSSTLGHPATAFNVITVANVFDQNTTARSDDVISTSSSRGPTSNGRKKPDLAAPGQATRSTSATWDDTCVILQGDCPDFEDIGGTSAAAPHVTGVATLIVDVRNNDDPLATKAVLLNSADAWTDAGTSDPGDDSRVEGSEWNKTYGWGYLDAHEAYFNATDVILDQIGDGDASARNRYYRGELLCRPSSCPNCSAEKATLVWNRHATYTGSVVPSQVEVLSDLDLLLYDPVFGNMLTSSVSAIDNVEQIACDNHVSHAMHPVVLRVKTYGSLDPDLGGVESFALATEEGFAEALPPELVQTPWVQTNIVPPNQPVEISIPVHNAGSLTAFGTTATMDAGASTVIAGANPQPLGNLDATPATASWTLRTPCSLDPQSFTVTSESSSWGDTWRTVETQEIFVAVQPMLTSPIHVEEIPMTFVMTLPADSWVTVGIAPATDHDLTLAEDMCITNIAESSTWGGTTRDFVVANGNVLGATTRYVLADYGTQSPYDALHRVAGNRAVAAAGGSAQVALSSNEPMETAQLEDVVAGATYSLEVERSSGSADLQIWLYSADRSTGSRSNADAASVPSGTTGDAALDFTASASGSFLVVLTNENGQSGSFTISSTCTANCDGGEPPLFADGFEDGSVSAWN